MRHRTQEELLDRMETILREQEDPMGDLGPILDELDAREGAVPFDTQAGWADLMARAPKQNRKAIRKFPLAAVIALVCLVTTVAAGSFGLHEKLADFFGAGEEQSALLAEGISQPKAVMLPGAMDGVDIEILQVVADQNSMFVLYEAAFPKSVVLPKDKALTWQTFLTQPPMEGNAALSMGHELLEVKDHAIVGVLSTCSFQPILDPGWATAKLQDLGYWENGTFVPLVEGRWHLYWKVDSIALGTTIHPNQTIQLKSGAAVVTGISLSPVSILLQVPGSQVQSDTVFLEFRDGTLWGLYKPDSQSPTWGFHYSCDVTEIVCMFQEPIDPDQVTAVIIEGNRVPIP